jgi:chemotaxis signal transduction protein
VIYKVYLDNYNGVVLEFHRQPCGIYVGSLAELLDKDWQQVPEYREFLRSDMELLL